MDLKNVQAENKKDVKDIPDESQTDFKKEDSEKLKRLGRQVED